MIKGGYNEVNPGTFALILLKVASDFLDRFGSILIRFGPFRAVFESFWPVSDCFFCVSDRFRIISDRFRIVSDRFRIVSGRSGSFRIVRAKMFTRLRVSVSITESNPLPQMANHPVG